MTKSGLAAGVCALLILTACDPQAGAGNTQHTTATTPQTVDEKLAARPDSETELLKNLDPGTFDPDGKIKNAPNDLVKAELENQFNVARCNKLRTWHRFEKWTGRVESLEAVHGGVKLTVNLDNNGRKLLYTDLIGTVSKSSKLYATVLALHEGGSTGTPLVVSGTIAWKPVHIPAQYAHDDDFRAKVYGVCSGLNDVPVTFSSVEPITELAK